MINDHTITFEGDQESDRGAGQAGEYRGGVVTAGYTL